jgi:hypothetical protein
MTVTEDTVEQAAIEWFEELGYAYLAGPSIAPGEPGAEKFVVANRIPGALEGEGLNATFPFVARLGGAR